MGEKEEKEIKKTRIGRGFQDEENEGVFFNL